MASPPTHNAGPSPDQGSQTLLSAPLHPPRPLRRQGAQFFEEEQAERDLEEAMMRSSSPLPESVLGKRALQDDDDRDGNDTEPDDGASPVPLSRSGPAPLTTNISVASQRYAVKKKLRPEQRSEVDAFTLDSDVGRQTKLFTLMLAIENKIDAQQSAAPPWTLSEDLKTNINKYCLAVMLSVKISKYKGDVPLKHVLEILKQYRFDLPQGIEHDYASWDKVTAQVSESLTQIRSKVKKQIRDSIAPNNINIYKLTQAIASGLPSVRPTVQLCARIALMRKIYCENKDGGGDKYWNYVDKRLKFVRDTADGSSAKVAKAFTSILQKDRDTYGIGDTYAIKEVIASDLQQQVDDVVEGVLDTSDATAVPGGTAEGAAGAA